MKKDFLVILGIIFILSLSFIGCKIDKKTKIEVFSEEFTPQEYYDKAIRHTVITDSAGHTLIFHEVGNRGFRTYAFSIEHSPECKKCCEIFD